MKRYDARSNPRAPPCAVLEEQHLDTAIHDCAGFDCGVPALNDYLRKFASQHRRRGVSQTYVPVDDSAPTQILGYYTLSAAQLEADSLSDAERKRLPNAAEWEFAGPGGHEGKSCSVPQLCRRDRVIARFVDSCTHIVDNASTINCARFQ